MLTKYLRYNATVSDVTAGHLTPTLSQILCVFASTGLAIEGIPGVSVDLNGARALGVTGCCILESAMSVLPSHLDSELAFAVVEVAVMDLSRSSSHCE